MRLATVSVISIVCAAMIFASGCVNEQQYKDLKLQNSAQERRIKELEGQVQAANLELEQAKRQIEALGGKGNVEMQALQQKVAALEEDIAKKKALIEAMQKQLGGATQLPAELSSMLEDWAKGSDLVSFDAARGIVKFKSDLLFEKGSDEVAPSALESVKSLCTILNTDQAKEFDIIIAGHTDDLPILKPETKAKHPSNWYLSAHRAITVLDTMTANGIVPERASIRGFGEFRPVVPNELNKKGNPQNRRVEIYIVPKGM
ncbi:MAG: OmpA family protein [Sedimentisphaerales bacterium]|jgi:chemotaxis protein MotB